MAASAVSSVPLPGIPGAGSKQLSMDDASLSPQSRRSVKQGYSGSKDFEASPTSASVLSALNSPRSKSWSKKRTSKDTGVNCVTIDLVVPMAPSEGVIEHVVAEEKLMKARQASEIRLIREKSPLQPPGYNNAGHIIIDLQHLPQLQRVSANTNHGALKIQHLDLRRCPLLQEIPPELFSEVTNLVRLDLKGCSALQGLAGIAQAQMLQRLDLGRCTSLRTLGMNGKDGVEESCCPSLEYVDFDGCHLLPDLQAWWLVKNKVTSKRSDHNAAMLNSFSHCMLRRNVEAGCPNGHALARYDVGSTSDLFCSHCMKRLPVLTPCQACLRCRFFGCQECIMRDEAALMLVVWAGRRRADAFEATRGEDSEAFRHSCREGVREKLKRALPAAREAMRSGIGGALLDEVRQDVQEAMSRVREQDLFDAHLLRGWADVISHFVPETAIQCFNGCGAKLTIDQWQKHEASCKFQLVACPNEGCGMMVRKQDLKHHLEVEKDLASAVESWNCPRIKKVLQVAKYHCSGCRMPGTMVNDAEAKLWDLTRKFKRLRDLGVLKRGNVSIDYDKCQVNIDKDIPFENRKEPDTSAEFKKGDEEKAERIVQDLSCVVSTLKVSMVLEGHTGATEPWQYWQELAKNRAILINDTMVRFGVPDCLGIPVGCPGGGAKVIVRPAKPADIFNSMDVDQDGFVDPEELQKAKGALGKFMTLGEIDSLILCADEDMDGRINIKEFIQSRRLLFPND
eukprot:gnl/MRDRNA2_/MRDRNA2_99227_c0_seq1.p1 gnl/MRDRNA2_/MRDRNA2_99227_c0~~gnl/MRDRNA2_/MRDRNA2_99227_c0_seq1.p1  ORF type:complete len:737 (+),score=132.27 gnl/MRDRNA2_/MRDRNA2_99227_c0_seq1:97-2307(+)